MTAPARRAYGELTITEVVTALHELARRVGVAHVTMRELAAELGASVPSVYYHVPGKRAVLNLLAESVLAQIPEPAPASWDVQIVELYCSARRVLLDVPGVAGVLQTCGDGETARRLDRLSRDIIAQSGLGRLVAAPAHTVLYTYLLGSVGLEESRPDSVPQRTRRGSAARFRAGLELIVSGIRETAAQP